MKNTQFEPFAMAIGSDKASKLSHAKATVVFTKTMISLGYDELVDPIVSFVEYPSGELSAKKFQYTMIKLGYNSLVKPIQVLVANPHSPIVRKQFESFLYTAKLSQLSTPIINFVRAVI